MKTNHELFIYCKQIIITIYQNNYKYSKNNEQSEAFRYYTSSHLF